jgi:hypothetical protein
VLIRSAASVSVSLLVRSKSESDQARRMYSRV